ncbi:MAG TPA: hypothetical protein VFL57_01945 [Bryobacteraceae bacterium]|nr:hypothetical protein [Bryobacteraceae bacterium]
MGHFALTGFIIGAFASVAAAQQPQLTWEGEVNGPTRLVIQGDRVELMGNSDVYRPDYRLYEPLPNRPGNVTAELAQGRGSVRVVEQPYRDNGFRAVVALYPRGRSEYMQVNMFWQGGGYRGGYGNDRDIYRDDQYGYGRRRTDTEDQDGYGRGRGVRNRRGDFGSGSLTWSGQVDQDAVIEIRGSRVSERTLRGRRVYRRDMQMTSPLPRTDTNVTIADARGRGQIEVVQQPNASNGYTAAVRIHDEESGSGDYSFTLNWGDEYGYQTGNTGVFGNNEPYYGSQPTYGSTDTVFGTRSRAGNGRILFSGRVDGRVRVTMQGGRYWVDTISGQPPRDIRVDFGSPLPMVPVSVDVQRHRGRDEVQLIQRPDANNGYRLIFEINDHSGGQDDYEIEIKW